MPAFVQALLTGQSKVAGTSLVLTGSKTVTDGNFIFVAFANDPGATTGFDIQDNLGNIYLPVATNQNPAGVETKLYVAGRVESLLGGTLTSITCSWIFDVTAKAAVSGEFAGLGELRGAYGESVTGTELRYAFHDVTPWKADDLVVAALGWEAPATDDLTPGAGVEVAQEGTTGAPAADNVTAQLLYATPSVDSVTSDAYTASDLTASAVATSAGAVYSALVATHEVTTARRFGPF